MGRVDSGFELRLVTGGLSRPRSGPDCTSTCNSKLAWAISSDWLLYRRGSAERPAWADNEGFSGGALHFQQNGAPWFASERGNQDRERLACLQG